MAASGRSQFIVRVRVIVTVAVAVAVKGRKGKGSGVRMGISLDCLGRYRSLSDQLIRSGPGVVLLIAEGANRFPSAQKRQRFVEARGECGEAAATVELSQRMGLTSPEQCRIGAMLTGLIQRHA